MSTFYLIDGHTTPLESSEINDVLISGTSVVTNGNFVIKVPDGVKLSEDPTNLTDLLNKKYQGILAQYPGFTNIIYDDLLDPSSISVIEAGNNNQAYLGYRGNIGYGSFSSLKTSATDISPTVLTQCIVLFELHQWSYSNPVDGRMDRIFEDITDTTSIQVDIYVDGVLAATSYQNGELVSIPLANQGSSIELVFPGALHAELKYLTSWALIY
jgi:hypothetical protein